VVGGKKKNASLGGLFYELGSHTEVAFLAKRAAEARRIFHDAIGSDALRQRTLSDRVSSVDERETARNFAWSTASAAAVEHQLGVRP
jgi:hypothetical protein